MKNRMNTRGGKHDEEVSLGQRAGFRDGASNAARSVANDRCATERLFGTSFGRMIFQTTRGAADEALAAYCDREAHRDCERLPRRGCRRRGAAYSRDASGAKCRSELRRASGCDGARWRCVSDGSEVRWDVL